VRACHVRARARGRSYLHLRAGIPTLYEGTGEGLRKINSPRHYTKRNDTPPCSVPSLPSESACYVTIVARFTRFSHLVFY